MSSNSRPNIHTFQSIQSQSRIHQNMENLSIFEDISIFSDNEDNNHNGITRVTKEAIIDNIRNNKYSDINSKNERGYTPLMYAIKHTDSKDGIISELIDSGNGKISEINNKNQTALILSLKREMEDIAIKLILTGLSIPEHRDDKGHNALYYAQKENLTDAINMLLQNTGQNIQSELLQNKKEFLYDVNINQIGYDVVSLDNITIKNFLEENQDNVVFIINGTPHLLRKNDIKTQLNKKMHIKYGCKEAGNGSQYRANSNIDFNPVYFSLSSISVAQAVVKKSQIKKVLNNSRHRIYVAKNTEKILPAIMSEAYLRGDISMSSDRCQSGKETPIYELIKANPIDEPLETTDARSQNKPHIINVVYGDRKYHFPVSLTTTLEEIKDLLIDKLIKKNKIKSRESDIQFAYKKMVYTEDVFSDVLLKNLKNPPYGITIIAQIKEYSGGKYKKTEKRRKSKSRKTNKRKNKAKK